MDEDDRISVAALLTSELVTNAVIHASPVDGEVPIGLRIDAGRAAVRVEVTDLGGGFDPEHPGGRPPEQGGRGLLLVDRLATRWGAGAESGRFTVWFELEYASTRV